MLQIAPSQYLSTLLAFAILFSPSNSVSGARQKYCGKQLLQIVEIICSEGVYSPSKRSSSRYDFLGDSSSDYNSRLQGDSILSRLLLSEGVIQPPENALKMYEKRSSQRGQGIVTECCDKPCTFDEISGYCMKKA